MLDGTVLGPWRIVEEDGGRAVIVVAHARRVGARAAAAIAAEGRRLLRLRMPGAASHEVRLTLLP
jgi:hypothetical protein